MNFRLGARLSQVYVEHCSRCNGAAELVEHLLVLQFSAEARDSSYIKRK